jgi:hypothetical protein
MFAQHGHNRRRLILAVAIGSGLFWSGIGLPVPAQAQEPDPATQLYVSQLSVGWIRTGGPQKQGKAVMDVVDGNGNPVNGALVVGNWSGCFRLNGVSDTTETVCTTASDGTTTCVDGRAVIWGKKYSCVKSNQNCLFTFTITEVQKDGMTYVPVEGKTTGSLWCQPLSATVKRGTKATWTSSRQIVTRGQQVPTRGLARWSRR